MRKRIFRKLFVAVLALMAVALATIDFLASGVSERAYFEALTLELSEKTRMLALLPEVEAGRIDAGRAAQLAEAAGGRLTIVRRDGRVLLDSGADPARMENHLDRPEVQRALAGETGSIVRISPTVGREFLYVASPLPYGAVRLAVPMERIRTQVNRSRWNLALYTSLAFLPAMALALLLARSIARQLGGIIEYAGTLATGDFKARLAHPGKGELGTLGRQLNETGEKLQGMFEALEREHLELEKLERVRRDFVINVSHELRTPLASIQGYTETLLAGAVHDHENNLRFLNIIRQNAERLARLTADLLTLSRIEFKTQQFQFASYFADALLADCLDSLRPLGERRRIALELLPAGAHVEVFCDAEAVHQIMSNLIDNAIKFSPEGATVTVSASAREDGFVEIRVADRGPGIPAEDLPRLFERFYRVDKARSRELGGTGLGLAIVKHLVRAMGGEVYVESQINHGSTFVYNLPGHDLGLPESGGPGPVQPQVTNL
jgi:two-component system phosphate regulon sensor histidine kinase PhoR